MSATLPFDVFHRLIRQALGETTAHDESLDLQVFRADDVPGAAVVKFFPEELAESLHAVYVPAGLDEDGTVMERLHEAVATHEGLVPEEDPARQRALLTEVRGLLERYIEATGEDLAADAADDDAARDGATDPGPVDAAGESSDDAGDDDLDSGAPPARIEFGPLEALEALGAAKDGLVAGRGAPVVRLRPRAMDEIDDEDDDEYDADDDGDDDADEFDEDVDDERAAPLPDDRPSFRALALDVLSGVPQPHGSAPGLPDSFEVWAYRHDPVATVVLRFFDGGRAVVLGALAPDEDGFDPGRFFSAAYQLLSTKAPAAIEGTTEGRLSDLEPLSTAPAMERLGRALGHEHTAAVRELTTDLLGEASPDTLDAYEQVRLLDPRAETSAAALFAAIARDVVEVGGDVLWTRRKEREAVPRIEVLEHRQHPGTVLLVDFGQPNQPVEVAAYVPGPDDGAPAFATDVRRMIETRALHDSPRPLDDNGAFRRVPNPQAVFAVESALDALEAGDGFAIAFRSAED